MIKRSDGEAVDEAGRPVWRVTVECSNKACEFGSQQSFYSAPKDDTERDERRRGVEDDTIPDGFCPKCLTA